MLKSNTLKFLTPGLILLLSACGSAEASQPAPVKEAPVMEAKVEEPQVEVVAPEVKVEAKAEAEENASVEVEPAAVAEESMAEVEETAPVDEQPAAMVEPVEEEVMKQEESATKVGPTAAQMQVLAGLDNQGMPSELFNEVWLNSEPLKLADLHGKVVIVEFWTFGCINCKNVLPSLREWHQNYEDDGLVIIGVHTPEFGYEGELENVKQALVDLDVKYPVAIDNDWQTWRAYQNRYWPAKYFVDKAGNLRHIHIGEGGYEQQEEIIRALLAEKV